MPLQFLAASSDGLASATIGIVRKGYRSQARAANWWVHQGVLRACAAGDLGEAMWIESRRLRGATVFSSASSVIIMRWSPQAWSDRKSSSIGAPQWARGFQVGLAQFRLKFLSLSFFFTSHEAFDLATNVHIPFESMPVARFRTGCELFGRGEFDRIVIHLESGEARHFTETERKSCDLIVCECQKLQRGHAIDVLRDGCQVITAQVERLEVGEEQELDTDISQEASSAMETGDTHTRGKGSEAIPAQVKIKQTRT